MLFDDPKKELERLSQQLRAAEIAPPEEDGEEITDALYGEEYDEDDALLEMFGCAGDAPSLYDRAAGFDAETEGEEYYMDEDRYAAPPKKKGFRGLVVFALLQAIVIIALAIWWLGQQL